MSISFQAVGGPHDGTEFSIARSKKNPPRQVYLPAAPSGKKPTWSSHLTKTHVMEYELDRWYDEGAGFWKFKRDTR